MKTYRNAREATRHDQRIILRSCALALLPGGKAQHQDIIDLMQVVTRSSKLNQDMLFDAYILLQQGCTRHLQMGPIQQLTQTIDYAVQRFAA